MSFLLFLCPLPRAAEVLWLFAVPQRSCGSSWSGAAEVLWPLMVWQAPERAGARQSTR